MEVQVLVKFTLLTLDLCHKKDFHKRPGTYIITLARIILIRRITDMPP